jgi:type I restriction enzyme R subunit
MNEAETRAEHIDPALKAAGWGVVPGSVVRREFIITPGRIEGRGRRGSALKADYVLVYRNHKLAAIEAKAWDEPVSLGVQQAKDYCQKMAVRYGYSTNGQGIYAVDMETGTEGEIDAFPGPDALWAMTFPDKRDWRDRFAEVPYPDKGGTWLLRYYQQTAVERVLERIAAGGDRALLTLATGTGKTSIAFQIVWKLFQSRWTLARDGTRRPRVLFLADRNNLADQAYNDFTSFNAFEDDALVRIRPDEIRKKNRVPKNGSVFFTIFQTFMSGPPKDGHPSPYFGEYPPDFFDFIVVDECHRGGANDESTWRDILEYFKPAVQLGLTATPKRKDNVDTYAYFGEPAYTYSLKEGINDGFLTPFKVRQISTTLDEYVYTSDDKLEEGEIESGRRYTEPDFNRIIEIEARERYRVKLFMGMIDPKEKTLVFCATQDHALAVRNLVNQMKASTDPNYCARVTAQDGERGNQFLRDFQDNEKTIPTILTTSQKLSTGVDARNVRNIVLMRPVKTVIEFKQIIGRGTRLYEGKDYFTIYDFVKAHHHFSDAAWDGEPLDETTEGPTAPEDDGPPPEPEQPETPDDEEEKPMKKRVRVRLAHGKERSIQHMMATTFWHADGKPMSAEEFLKMLFGAIPDFFQNEAELRALWSAPETRKKLLDGLAEKGFGREQLAEMQRLIDAERSDIFDVLAYVAFELPPLTRAQRAAQAKGPILTHYTNRQQAFLDFVLAHYVQDGVDELAPGKLSTLLRIKYNNALADAFADLGKPEEIGRVFATFQQYLYVQGVA